MTEPTYEALADTLQRSLSMVDTILEISSGEKVAIEEALLSTPNTEYSQAEVLRTKLSMLVQTISQMTAIASKMREVVPHNEIAATGDSIIYDGPIYETDLETGEQERRYDIELIVDGEEIPHNADRVSGVRNQYNEVLSALWGVMGDDIRNEQSDDRDKKRKSDITLDVLAQHYASKASEPQKL